MSARFWVVAAAVHVVLVAVSVSLGRWCAAGAADHTGRWVARLLAASGLFGGAAVAASLLGALVAGGSGFTVMRFLAQALFGEAVLLAAALAVVHGARRMRLRAALLAVACLGLLAVYAEAYHLEPHRLVVQRHSLDLSRGAPSGRTLRILHVTDIQSDEIGPHEDRALRLGVAEKPDLVVLTGDYVHERFAGTKRANIEAFRELLARVGLGRAPLGAFAVRGDVDGGDWGGLFTGTGVRPLLNEAERITLPGGKTLAIVGLDPYTSRGRFGRTTRAVVDDAPAADLTLVLGHSPDYVAALSGPRRVDLALAGHTHGGQVAIPFFGPPITLSRLPRRYAGGLNDYQGIPLHVSRGVGMERGTAPQIRFLVPPEVCVIDARY